MSSIDFEIIRSGEYILIDAKQWNQIQKFLRTRGLKILIGRRAIKAFNKDHPSIELVSEDEANAKKE